MKISFVAGAILGVALVALLVVAGSVFTVAQTEQALVLRFGDPVPGRTLVSEPGLHFKWPLVDQVVLLDKRLLDVETSQQEILTHDSQRLVVDAFLRYRIVDPLKFYQTVRNTDGASNQLGSVLDSVLRLVLGDATLTDVVRDHRDALMAQILQLVNDQADKFGVKVVDARIRRADFPQEISAGVYSRMQSERQREAAQYRAQGSELAQTIRAKADRDVTVLTAQAQQQADAIRGEGDAERNRILAKAYSKDPGFFAFYRSMQAYAAGLSGDATRLVIGPNSDFFRYFNDPSGKTDASPTSKPKTSPPLSGQPQASNE
jgi:modulator of FtsH protease HflC